MAESRYMRGVGIYNPTAIKNIKKSDQLLQPIFEAITNGLEAIEDKYQIEQLNKGKLCISFFVEKTLLNDVYNFDRIVVSDNGIGLTNECFNRLINLRDDRKGYSNKGTGRVQYIHSFEYTTIESSYQHEEKYLKRIVTLSNNNVFQDNNAIVRIDSESDSNIMDSETKVTFTNPLDSKLSSFLSSITSQNLKVEITRHFLAKLCDIKDHLPSIEIKRFINGVEEEVETVQKKDIPKVDKVLKFNVFYRKHKNKEIVKTENQEEFCLRCFKLNSSDADLNKLIIVSKGEEAKKMDIYDINQKDSFEGNRFLFLLSSPFFDKHDSDTRGELQIITEKEFKSQDPELFPQEEITFDDIEIHANEKISANYNDFQKSKKEKERNLNELKNLFLIRPEIIESIKDKVKNGDSDEEILKRIYTQEVSDKAENDAKLKFQIDEIRKLDPSDSKYEEDLQNHINKFTTLLPLQKRAAICQYVTRRKMVLEIFDSLLGRYKNVDGDSIKEKLFHNLFFRQHSDEAEKSDMWLMNEDFVFFSGLSEFQLNKATLKNGDKLLKENLNEEESAYKHKMSQDAGERRPDVLLFPDEGKCIIIEFKAPDVDVSIHLNQINRYATLIHNLCNENYRFDTFYGYLVGENIDIDQIRDLNSEFLDGYHLNYIYRPYYRVAGKFGKQDGSLYTEIIRYSDILERAKRRNKILTDFLPNP